VAGDGGLGEVARRWDRRPEEGKGDGSGPRS